MRELLPDKTALKPVSVPFTACTLTALLPCSPALPMTLSHHGSLQGHLSLGLCAELTLCNCSVPTAPEGAHSVLTSHSVQCCSSLKCLSSHFSCWFQVEQPVLLTPVCLSLEWEVRMKMLVSSTSGGEEHWSCPKGPRLRGKDIWNGLGLELLLGCREG